MTSIAPLRSRHTRERGTWPGRARRFSVVPVLVVLVYAVAVLVVRLLGIDSLITFGPGESITRANTAVIMGLVCGGLLGRPGSRASWWFFGAALTLSTLVLVQYVFSVDLGIDRILPADGYSSKVFPGRPAATTACAFVFLSLSGLLTAWSRRVTAQLTAAAGLLLGVTGAFGYVFGVDGLYSVGNSTTMQPSTATVIVVLALMLWLAVPQGALQWVAFGSDSGARAQRVLVPVALGLVPTAAWLFIQGIQHGVFGVAFGTALLTSFCSVVLVVVGYRTGRTAFSMDLERDTLLDELHRVNGQLEDRVRVKVHQLNRQKTKLALFEERDRIARDLHDRVIQRIFAAGLQISSLSRTAKKQAAAQGTEDSLSPSLDLIAIELDLAIRELRNSIFELTSIGDLDNIEQVVRDIATRASRILGFMPRIAVSGEVAGVHADLVAQLASVIQEGLSNVARHAQASAVEVALAASSHDLQLRITDDGLGLPDPLPRSSGISNVMNRARQLGGTATWSARTEGVGEGDTPGTVLTWRVPRSGQPLEEPHGYDTPVESSETDQRAEAAVSS